MPGHAPPVIETRNNYQGKEKPSGGAWPPPQGLSAASRMEALGRQMEKMEKEDDPVHPEQARGLGAWGPVFV